MKLSKFILFIILFFAVGRTEINAQSKKKSKTKTTQTDKLKKTAEDDGEYYHGHKVYTGPRGGKYYINKNGNKTYIKH